MIVQNLIFAMSLSGSVVVLLYILTCPLAKRCFPLKWRYLVLKLAVMFYLIPFPYGICKAVNWLRSVNPLVWKIFPDPFYQSPELAKQMVKSAVTLDPSGKIFLSRDLKRIVFVIALLMLIAVFAVLRHLLRYWRVRRRWLKEAREADPEQWDLFCRIKQEIGLRRKVRLFCSDVCGSPVVMGIFCPVVVLPSRETACDASDAYMIRHELLHIRNNDLPVKFLGLTALAFHWFNPLCCFLYYELANMSEICCDQDVIRGKGEQVRKEYGGLLLELATEKSPADHSRLLSGLLHGSGGKVMKRRILEMKQKGKKHSFLSVLMFCGIGLAGILMGFTYQEPMLLDEGHVETTGSALFPGAVKALWGKEWSDVSYDPFVPSEYVWTDQNGAAHALRDEPESMDSCDHAFYQDGELYRYKEKDDGTEEKEICEALRCSRCGYVLKGREIVEIPSDDYWIGEDGTVLKRESAIWDSDPCSHGSDAEGTIYEHRKDAEGGCRTEVFSGLRCSVCGQIRIGIRQYEITYPSCAHRYQNGDYVNGKEW